MGAAGALKSGGFRLLFGLEIGFEAVVQRILGLLLMIFSFTMLPPMVDAELAGLPVETCVERARQLVSE